MYVKSLWDFLDDRIKVNNISHKNKKTNLVETTNRRKNINKNIRQECTNTYYYIYILSYVYVPLE